MDFSSLPEDQQKQLQQLQKQFEEHQLQQQQQQQQQQQLQQQQQQQQQQIQNYAAQAYDPTQVQAYDQSYYAYYQYQNPQQSQQYSQQQEHQHYGYYQPDYSNAYQHQPQLPHQQYSQPESVATHPSVIAGPGESQQQIAESGRGTAPTGMLGQGQHQQNAYYQQQAGPVKDQQTSGFPVPPGLNPAAAAAVAALSQLTQFAGTMEAAEKAMAMAGLHSRGGAYGQMMGPGPGLRPFMGPGQMHHGLGPVDQSLYRGGSRRGGRPFTGNSQGNFGHRPPRPFVAGPPSRGRGRDRGRGGPRRFPPHGESSSSQPKPSANEAEDAEPTADNDEEHEATPTSALKEGYTAPNKRPSQVAWCELCRVDCTSMEILEQHKNGKKHKKNLQRLEELRSASKLISGLQPEKKSVADSSSEVNLYPQSIHEGEENKETLPENVAAESVNNVKNVEADQQPDKAEQPEVPVEEQPSEQGRKPLMNRSDEPRRGTKRKMRGGRGGKRMKTSDGTRRQMEPPKPKVVIPLICDLCNVKCDTQEVFDRHLSGKKHISKLKRFEGHQAMYGPLGLQALYPPNPITQTLFLPQGPQQAFHGPQGSYPPPGSYMPPQTHHSAPLATGAGSGLQQSHNHQALGANYDLNGESAVSEVQQQPALVVTGTNQNDMAAETGSGNGV